jgi:hypothetical protein
VGLVKNTKNVAANEVMMKSDDVSIEVLLTNLLVRVSAIENVLIDLKLTSREKLNSISSDMTEKITAMVLENIKKIKENKQ